MYGENCQEKTIITGMRDDRSSVTINVRSVLEETMMYCGFTISATANTKTAIVEAGNSLLGKSLTKVIPVHTNNYTINFDLNFPAVSIINSSNNHAVVAAVVPTVVVSIVLIILIVSIGFVFMYYKVRLEVLYFWSSINKFYSCRDIMQNSL